MRTMQAADPRTPRLLRRYAGIRLYDVESRTYVSVAQLRTWLDQGRPVVVREAETGQFVTEAVIAAIRT